MFGIFLKLGLTSFGGPVAHIGYFRAEFVARRRWLGEHEFADLLALCQLLPGPASSQMGMAIGAMRAGPAGAIAAWLGFTLPSALLMYACARGFNAASPVPAGGVLHGLQLIAVAVVAQAVASMARSFCTDMPRVLIAMMAAVCMLRWHGPAAQAALLAGVALMGAALLRSRTPLPEPPPARVPVRVAGVLLMVFLGLLIVPPLLERSHASPAITFAQGMYRSGALVFGGGHVVLPMLQAQVAEHSWMSEGSFLAGYSAAQALPGPLFSFAAYIGAASDTGLTPEAGAVLGTVAIFLPSLLLVLGVVPFWNRLRALPRAQSMLAGINAAVVGLLLAALYQPVITTAVHGAGDAALAAAALLALLLRAPPWCVVAGGALAGWLLMGN